MQSQRKTRAKPGENRRRAEAAVIRNRGVRQTAPRSVSAFCPCEKKVYHASYSPCERRETEVSRQAKWTETRSWKLEPRETRAARAAPDRADPRGRAAGVLPSFVVLHCGLLPGSAATSG